MYTIKKAEFMLCAAWPSQWPDESLPEVVMAGRSNVGKSSFINTVTNVQGLAKVSSTPGKTRTLNFFNINDEVRLVDVPGYGYAKVPKKMLEQFSEMIDNYLRNRKNLKAMILIVDYRHKPKDDDVTMYDYAKHFGIPVIVVATKEDKLKRNELVKNEKLIKETLDFDPSDHFVRFSSLKKKWCQRSLGLYLRIMRREIITSLFFSFLHKRLILVYNVSQEGSFWMIKILLCCASGMSTSLLVEKMKRAATKQNVEAEIWAVNAENTDLKDVEADIIFLGPQVRYAKEEIQKTVGSIPVYMIGMKDYGMMNGDSVLAQALEYLGK